MGTRKLNICLIAYTYYELDQRVIRYAESLINKNNRIDVISLSRKKGENKHIVINGVNIYCIQHRNYNENGPLSYLSKMLSFFIKGSIFLLFRYIRYRYDVIHIHNIPDFFVFIGLIPKLLGAMIIFDIHDILPEFYCQKFNRRMNSLMPKILLFVEKMSVKFADHVIVANDIWREKIIKRDKILPEKTTTILNYPNKILNKKLSKKLSHDRINLIYPGTISYHHGIDIAIRAMTIVKKQLSNVFFNIYGRAGDLKYFKVLRMMIDNLELNKNVKIFDPVPFIEIEKIYENAHIGIVTKRDGIFSGEAFSTKIFDYMAAGIPIIASRTKIDTYYFDDSLIMFFEPEDYEDLAKCIIELCNNQTKRNLLVKNTKMYITQNSWDTKKKIYLNLLNRSLR